MTSVEISNKNCPESGSAEIILPIPDDLYSRYMETLRRMGIGDVMAPDCHVEGITDAPPVLDCLVGSDVNVDELDFLFRVIDNFSAGETAKFQSMAAKLDLKDISDLINLSFCSDRATVITDFSDLDAVGKRHYMTIHGGICPAAEYNSLNGEGIARNLIASGAGAVTPYGVVYDNDLQLESLYTGRNFPAYSDTPYLVELDLGKATNDPKERPPVIFFLPLPEERLKRLISIFETKADKIKNPPRKWSGNHRYLLCWEKIRAPS